MVRLASLFWEGCEATLVFPGDGMEEGACLYYCHRCGEPWRGLGENVAVHETCQRCGAMIHCCMNCAHYDADAPRECRNEEAEFVTEKHGKNFCEAFAFRSRSSPPALSPTPAASREKWERLFTRLES